MSADDPMCECMDARMRATSRTMYLNDVFTIMSAYDPKRTLQFARIHCDMRAKMHSINN